jgi:DNA polymerase I-like protein with 3'-5' exonuclease and polymerase domains
MNFPNLTNAKEIWFDTETYDPKIRDLGAGWARRDSAVIGFSLAVDDEAANYYQLLRDDGSRKPTEDRANILRWLQDDVWASGLPIGGHNIGYDIGGMLNEGLPLPNGSLRDSMTAAPLLDEELDHYSLEFLSRLWLGEGKLEDKIKEYADEHLLDPKADLWRMPVALVGKYANQDVELTRKLIRHIEARIREEDARDAAGGRGSGLCRAMRLEYDLIPCSIAMRWKGLRLDLNELERAANKLRVLRERSIKEVMDRWGLELRPWVPTSVARLFDECGLKYPVNIDPDTGKATPSFVKPWLLAQPHDAARLVLAARAGAKSIGTFIKGWEKHLVGDRIHPEWHQTRSDEGGTISFRYSCSAPNLQQVPHKDRTMADILLPVFISDDGEELHSLDYHQQEPGLAVHYAHLLNVAGSDEIWQRYQSGGVDFHDVATELIERMTRPAVEKGHPDLVAFEAARTIYKQINLGLMYGMGKAKLRASTGKDDERADEILADHKRQFSFIYALARVCTARAANQGWIRALGGHKRRFDLWEPARFSKVKVRPLRLAEAQKEWPETTLRRAYSYTGMNALIQTSAAAQMKAAMLAAFRAGIVPSLQIHDE